MTRKGKIARLPRAIRDELNRRLDDGEQGIRLVEWLNGLPEVKKVLESDFEGRAITDGNLADWKNGGFLDWQAQQETRALIEDWKSGVEELASSAELAELFTTVLMTHYAAAVQRSNADVDEEPRERVKRLGKSLRDITRLRRCELTRERAHEQAEIGRERVELMRERLELERRRLEERYEPTSESTEAPFNSNEIQPMTEEEKTELLRELLLPKDEAGTLSDSQVGGDPGKSG
jgi:hypothetical protein